LKELPPHLVNALLTREDRDFFQHNGFTVIGILRAVWGQVIGQNLGGGSTITQQLAGTLYADRHEKSIKRKLVELWYALQMERRFSKQEILEMYLNRMYMGSGCYGVEAASKYYFGHSAREISLAESAVLVVQLSSPATFNPIEKPNEAQDRSRYVLDEMVTLGYCSAEEADASFKNYWDNYNYQRVATSAFYMRDDKAPWFSEYVHRELKDSLYGSIDIYRDGLTVKTTVDLDYQAVADRLMTTNIIRVNKEYLESTSAQLKSANRMYAPIAEMLALLFNLRPVFSPMARIRGKTYDRYFTNFQPVVDMLSILLDIDGLKSLADEGYKYTTNQLEKTKVEGALVSIDNETGHILALVGGSKYEASNQKIRATQGRLQPGSSFKPFLYSAALDTKRITQATMLYDAPIVFYNSDGSAYIPNNYGNIFRGPVLMWSAVANSLNIPAIKTLDMIGFDATINRAAKLLRVTDPAEIKARFPRFFPLALGICSVSPLQMALGYSAFANGGREIEPIAIISVEDRDGRIILEPEKEAMLRLREKGSAAQLISAENAFVMTDILKKTCTAGTLYRATDGGKRLTYTDAAGQKYTIPVAGKTGTTQNWADVWSLGMTPYNTTAIWFGFDMPGSSLGNGFNGAALAGQVWGDFAYEIHKNLPYKDFPKAPAGCYVGYVCRISGLWPTKNCNEGTIGLWFMPGTGAGRSCDVHQGGGARVFGPDFSGVQPDGDIGGATSILDEFGIPTTGTDSGSSTAHNPNRGKRSTPPSDPRVGDYYFDPNALGNGAFYVYNGNTWEIALDLDGNGVPD
jgi:penicillin-binding protein 1A